MVQIHLRVWHKFKERWRKETLPKTEEGRLLCFIDSPNTIPFGNNNSLVSTGK